MHEQRKIPVSVTFCNQLIRALAWLVPGARREEWKREWMAEIWHRWQFLYYAGGWDRLEALRLIRNCTGAFVDAAWHLIAQDGIQTRLRDWPRSAWMCLGVLTAVLLIAAAITSGFPATRQLLTAGSDRGSRQLFFVWLHPIIGGGDKGLPPDVVPAWATHSRLLDGVAGFTVKHAPVQAPGRNFPNVTVVVADTGLFPLLGVRPSWGSFPIAQDPSGGVLHSEPAAVVLDHSTWMNLFHGQLNAVGSIVKVGQDTYPVAAVLPASFHFLTRQPSLYVIRQFMPTGRVLVVARARPSATLDKINRELTKISEDVCYYFFSGQLRMLFLRSAILTPLQSFAIAVFVAGLLSAFVWRVPLRHIQRALSAQHRKATLGRAAFFAAKTALALTLVFVAGLEWSRSESSFLFGSRDPGSGPFLLWLYILCAMGVFSWSVADQRARCRVCLRLLCFPVRIGCPGCLLLDWSGTELLCTEGHGLLHVPHLAPSWDEQSQHWISLDDSWRGLFAHSK